MTAFAALARALAVATTAVTFAHASSHSHNHVAGGGHEHGAPDLGRPVSWQLCRVTVVEF